MDFVFWIILLVVLAAVLWWLLKRKAPADGKTAPHAVADGPVQPATERSTSGAAAGGQGGSAAGTQSAAAGDVPLEQRRLQDEAEWETQWSETSGSAAGRGAASAAGPGSDDGRKAAAPVHRPEYTAAQAPTLPGAETAAAEDAAAAQPAAEESTAAHGAGTDAAARGPVAAAGTPAALPADAPATETWDRAQSSALVESGASHSQEPAAASEAPAEPAGHLAADEPYGSGSAAAAPDGTGPSGFTVKGDAAAMVYYEEGHPEYEQTRANVWFESAAHAEAAGFRAPRRRRLQ